MIKEGVCTAAGAIAGVVSYFVGGFDPTISIFVTVLIVDTLTGMLKAFNSGTYESSKFRQGFVKKFGYMIGIILTVQIDMLLTSNGVLRDAVVTFFITNEAISVIENLGEMGVKFPDKFTQAIKVLEDKNKSEDKVAK